MASQHIEITATASRLSADVRRAIDDLESLQDAFANIKAIFDQVTYGGDYASLATKLGVSEADAETIYNIWGSAETEITATFLTQLQARLG